MSTPGQTRAESLLSMEKRMLQMIANKVSLPDVLENLCLTIDAHAPGVISTVLLMDPDEKRLWPGAGPRFPTDLIPAISPWPIGPDRGACGAAAFLKRRVIISDITNDPRWPDDYRALAVSHGLRAAWSEPLVSDDGAVLGTFAMYYAEPRTPDNADLELIEMAGDIALIAIQMERSQAALRENEERFRLAMSNVASGLYTFDLQGLVTYVNPAAEKMFGWTNAELLGKKMHDVTHYKHPDGSPFPATDCPDLQVLQKGTELHEHEDMFIRKDGSFLPVVYSASALQKDGQTVGIVVGFRDDTQRREAERAVRESEERFRLVANTAPVMIWMSDTDGLSTYVNQPCLEFSGKPLEAALGRGWAENLHPEDVGRSWDTYRQALERREPFQIEHRLRRHDGQYRRILASGVPRFKADGSFAGYIGSAIDLSELKQSEEALQKSEERLRLAMDSGKLTGWDRDVKSGRDSLFGDLQGMFGIPSEIYDGRVEDFHRYLHPEDRRRVVEAIDYAMGMHKPYAAEFRLRWPDGTVRWLAAKGKFHYSREGDPERMLGMAIDITDRKLAEEALRESEERYRLAIQAGRMYAFDWDVATDVIVRSEGSSRIFGLTAEPIKLTKRELLTRVHPEDRATFCNSLAECTPESPITQISYRLLRPDGSVLWLERTGHAFFDEQGKMVRMIGMVTDITEHKRAEDKLQEYERAVEGLEEMMVVVDREYRYLIANNKFLKMQNMTKGQVVGRFAHEVLNKGVFEGVVKEKLDECFQGKVVRYEMKYTYPELGERDLLVSYFPIEGAIGVDRVACIVQDITERKLAEEALSTVSQKLIEAHEEERTRIARELHDDVRQRLVLLAWQLGSSKGDLRKQIEDLLNDVQALSHHLHSPKLDYMGLAAAAAGFCRELSDRQRVEIEFHSENIPKELPKEISLCLFRVLQEALQNAIKHSGSRQFQVSLKDGTNEIELTVHDSGRGFDPEEAIQGRGLGLTSMRERLKLVNGELSIHSQLERGTTIKASVPFSSMAKSVGAGIS